MAIMNKDMSMEYIETAKIITAFSDIFDTDGAPAKIDKPSFYIPDDAVSEVADIPRICGLVSNIDSRKMNDAYISEKLNNVISAEFIYKAIRMFNRVGVKPKDLLLVVTKPRQPVYVIPKGTAGVYSHYAVLIAPRVGYDTMY